MKHSFLVHVAEKIGTEPAILESELSFIADNFGCQMYGYTSFTISISRLKRKFSYFEKNISDCIIAVDSLLPFDIYASDSGREILVEIDDRWLSYRGDEA